MTDFLPYIVIGLTYGSVYSLAGTGLVLTYKTSGIFNFSHGTVAAAMAYAFFDLREKQGLPWPVALAICVLVLAPLTGLLFERMARRLADAPVAMKVVATVGLIVLIQQVIAIRYGGFSQHMEPFLPTRTYEFFDVAVGIDQMIIVATALAGMLGLTFFLRSGSGRRMRAVVDQPDLLAMTGTSPVRVRRGAWMIGTTFAALSGILLAPTIGLDAIVLTLLVVQAFGAAAIGMFTSIPITYFGGLALGVGGALSGKYVSQVSWLDGLPPSLPFVVLFVVLVVAPSRWLVDFTIEKKPAIREPLRLPPAAKWIGGLALAAGVLWLPYLVGSRIPVWTSALGYVLIFLSLALLMRTSGQVSLAQLSFAAVGAAAGARLTAETDLPWLVAVLVGSLFAVPVGALLAIPAIRRSGLYLALATFGFAILIEKMVFYSDLMFGLSNGALPARRPSIAQGDRAYFYVALAFVVAGIAFVTLLHRSRLGRLLRAMADSPTALATSGTSVTAIKVIVFCIASFIAAVGGSLLGPVTGHATPGSYIAIAGLLVVVLVALIPGSEVVASIGAAISLTALPVYIDNPDVNEFLPVLFGVSAVLVAMGHAGMQAPGWMVRAASGARRRAHRSPATARVAARPQPEAS